MGERRSLIEGLKTTEADPALEAEFVFGTKERVKPKMRVTVERMEPPHGAATPGGVTAKMYRLRVPTKTRRSYYFAVTSEFQAFPSSYV
jgi:hypothetical protein